MGRRSGYPVAAFPGLRSDGVKPMRSERDLCLVFKKESTPFLLKKIFSCPVWVCS